MGNPKMSGSDIDAAATASCRHWERRARRPDRPQCRAHLVSMPRPSCRKPVSTSINSTADDRPPRKRSFGYFPSSEREHPLRFRQAGLAVYIPSQSHLWSRAMDSRLRGWNVPLTRPACLLTSPAHGNPRRAGDAREHRGSSTEELGVCVVQRSAPAMLGRRSIPRSRVRLTIRCFV